MDDKNLTVETIEQEEKTSFWNKAKAKLVQLTDQNSDGTFDKEDVAVVAGAISDMAKSAATAIKTSAEDYNRERELKALAPVFQEDLNGTDFLITKLVRLTDIDKRHADSDLCAGSIAHMIHQKDIDILNIYKSNHEMFGLTFTPDMDSDLYYADPVDRNHYIALDNYFDYLKAMRVSELQKVAQDLGAKYFRVTYKEKKATFSSSNAKAKANSKTIGSVDASHERTANESSTIEISAEMACPGHAPVEPKLRYLQRDPSIQSLIELRMDPSSPLSHQLYTIELKNTSGIKEKDAIKIDAALKALKISGNTTVTNEVQTESRRFFEYEIDF